MNTCFSLFFVLFGGWGGAPIIQDHGIVGSILGSPCREADNTVLVWRYMIQFKHVGFLMPSVYGEHKEMMFPVDQALRLR